MQVGQPIQERTRGLCHIFFLVLLAGALRALLLTKESLWFDEIASLWFAAGPLEKALVSEPTNPPLYYILLHFWIKLFGTSEAALRSLSIFPGIASVVLTYLLGLRLFDRRVALIAGCYVAVSTFHIYYSQEARAFALLVALLLGSTLSLVLVLKQTTKKTPWVPWLCYFLTTVGSLYTHFYAVFFVFAQNVFVLVAWRKNHSRLLIWISVQAAVLVVFSPWLFQMLETASGGRGARRYLLLKLPQAIFSFLAGDTLIPQDGAAAKDVKGTLVRHWHLLLAAMIGFGFFFVHALKGLRSRLDGVWLCGTMFLLPVIVAFVVSFKIMIFDERYLIGASPFLYLLFATGLDRAFFAKSIARTPWFYRIRILASVLVVAVLSISLFNYYFHPSFGREQWREAVSYIESNLKAGDAVVFEPGYINLCYEYYAKAPVEKLLLTKGVRERSSQAWAVVFDRIASHQRIWLVRSHVREDELLLRLQQLLSQESKKTFPKAKGIDVYLMKIPRQSKAS
jgi:uncharacterized membrane protein